MWSDAAGRRPGQPPDVLTGSMAKPAVPFGGKFRIIDFPLSNCTNSGIDTVGVLTQYRPLELNTYIGSGQPWELDRVNGGVHILPPYQSAAGAVWYKGTANAIYQNIGFVDLYDPEYVLVLSGDHIYKMDYSLMLRRHKRRRALTAPSPSWRSPGRRPAASASWPWTVMIISPSSPRSPRSRKATWPLWASISSPGKSCASTSSMMRLTPAATTTSEKHHPRYAAKRREDVRLPLRGLLEGRGHAGLLWDANMDMLSPGSGLNLLDKKWRIYGRTPTCPPTYIGKTGDVGNSAVAKGCTVLGEVKNAVLSTGTTVAEGASVSYSVVMPGAVIEAGAKVSYAIVGEGCRVGRNAVVGGAPGSVPFEDWGIAVLGVRTSVADGAVIEPKMMLGENGKEVRP